MDERMESLFICDLADQNIQDPCGALYDPATNLYHMHYQFHPLHVNWGKTPTRFGLQTDLSTLTVLSTQGTSRGDTPHHPT